MFRVSHQIAALCLAMGLSTGMAGGPAFASVKSVALVCDGEYRATLGGLEENAEQMFSGTMHVALIERDGAFVEIRLQAYEGDTRLPVQAFVLEQNSVSVVDADEAPKPRIYGRTARASRAETATPVVPAQQIRIDADPKEVVLHQTIESGPMMRARVDGKPLVPTRERVATVDLRLNRISGDLNVVWNDNEVRNHRLPGAIRASKVRLTDEKMFNASCRPVRQRAF